MSRRLDDGAFFHGTIADLGVGEFLTAGRPSNYRFYRAGEYCPSVDAGDTTEDALGRTLTCENNNGLRWEHDPERAMVRVMGFRFRKSINLGGGLRLNLGSKSVGLSAGGRGARVSINSRGRRTTTLGLPGTGLRWTSTGSRKRRG